MLEMKISKGIESDLSDILHNEERLRSKSSNARRVIEAWIDLILDEVVYFLDSVSL